MRAAAWQVGLPYAPRLSVDRADSCSLRAEKSCMTAAFGIYGRWWPLIVLTF